MKWFCKHSTCVKCRTLFDARNVEPSLAIWCSRCREPHEEKARRLARLKSWCHANESRLTEQMEKEEKEAHEEAIKRYQAGVGRLCDAAAVESWRQQQACGQQSNPLPYGGLGVLGGIIGVNLFHHG